MKKLIWVILILGILMITAMGCSPTIHDDGWVNTMSTNTFDNRANLVFIPAESCVSGYDLNATLIKLQAWIDNNKDKEVISITYVSIDSQREGKGFLIYYK